MTNTIVFILAGMTIGATLAWLVARRLPHGASDIILREQNSILGSENTKLKEQLLGNQKLLGQAEAIKQINEEQKVQVATLEQKLESVHKQLQQAEQDKIKVQEQKEALEKLQTEQKAAIAQVMAEQEKQFVAMQAKSQSEFSRMTAESISTLKKQTEEAFSKSRAELQMHNNTLLTPLNDTMNRFNGTLEKFKETSMSNHEALKNALARTMEMNETLSKEAENLTNALKAPKTQGNWGELTLEEVLSSGGLVEGTGYTKQAYFKTEENGRQFPDFIVHLPGDRHIIIDSKMSINSYVKWCNATSEPERQEYIKKHVTAMKERIEELSSKNYQKQLSQQGLDFVFMFIPIEYAYFAAIKEEPDLISFAKDKQVALVTPSNLFAVIQVVSQMWRVERTNKTIEKILHAGALMHQRVVAFAEQMQNIKKHLDSASDAYEDADRCLRGQKGIIKSAQVLENYGIKHQKSLSSLLEDSDEPLALPAAQKSPATKESKE